MPNKKYIPIQRSSSPFERNTETQRPFRLWRYDMNDRKVSEPVRWRCYLHKTSAYWGGLKEASISDPGAVIEVYDIRTGKLQGQFVRRAHNIDFME